MVRRGTAVDTTSDPRWQALHVVAHLTISVGSPTQEG